MSYPKLASEECFSVWGGRKVARVSMRLDLDALGLDFSTKIGNYNVHGEKYKKLYYRGEIKVVYI